MKNRRNFLKVSFLSIIFSIPLIGKLKANQIFKLKYKISKQENIYWFLNNKD